MAKQLRALVAEDSVDDFDLLMRALDRGGYVVEAARVDTAAAMAEALRREPWDLVFSDWSMPGFGAMPALAVLRESGLDLPFIIVSGTVGEDTAVEALKSGAHDFLVKGRLARLGVVIERELREANVRRERARMHEQLLVSDRMASVGILAAGVAHEINNPLAALLANIELALKEVRGLDPAAVAPRGRLLEGLGDARAAADRVRNIVRDLHSFSRAEEELRGPVDLEKVMESTLRLATTEIRHRARLVRQFSKVRPVMASEARLGQVFLNLLVNAAQALPEGRADEHEIRVTTAMAGDQVRIEVSDTGPGIPPEVLKRLFTPFVTTKPKGAGTGLGLSICHRIVSNFGGEIQVTTGASGTTFAVLLPAADAEPEHEVTQPLPPRRAPRRGRILVVDDDPMISKAIIRVLGNDHDTSATTRGQDALAMLSGGARFDVILCDVMMPEMTGPELYEHVVGIAPDQAARIVFVTGGTFSAAAREFLDRVPNTRIEKPFETEALRAVINSRVH